MSTTPRRRHVRVAAAVLAYAAWFATLATAQTAAGTQGPGEIESDPIKCWWKTDKAAVQVGEQFTLALTCGVIDTSRIRVVPDLNRLDPMAVELTPFEVLGGARHRDIEAPPWRYLQYSYTVRLIGEEFFGRDVILPSVQLTYNVQSSSDGGTRGRNQLYVLPALSMRILSLVPTDAKDISDASPETFADIEARDFRATAELTAAGVFFAFAAVLAGLAVVRRMGRRRARVTAVVRPLSLSAVLQGCLAGTNRLKSEVAVAGWSPELIGRALTMFRIAGAVALGRPVAQQIVNRRAAVREGQLVLRKGILRPKRALISAPTTEAAITARLADVNGQPADPRAQAMLEEIQEALRVFGSTRYSRNGHVDASALDAALDNGMRAIRRLRVTKLWPMRAADALALAAAEFRDTVWSR